MRNYKNNIYRLQLTDSARPIASSLSNLFNNLAELKLNVNLDMVINNVKRVKINRKIVTAVLNMQTLKLI